jgi:hypothetical protein
VSSKSAKLMPPAVVGRGWWALRYKTGQVISHMGRKDVHAQLITGFVVQLSHKRERDVKRD